MQRKFIEIFKEKSISPSYTRTRIYAYLEENKTHPTADEIYRELHDDLPTLSKTTVYNVLKLFIDKELVKPVNMNSSEVRYELNEYEHSHFKCKKCGAIYDIDNIVPSCNIQNIPGFIIESKEVNLTGICPDCLQEK